MNALIKRKFQEPDTDQPKADLVPYSSQVKTKTLGLKVLKLAHAVPPQSGVAPPHTGSIAQEWVLKSPLPRDLEAVRGLNPSDFNNHYVHYATTHAILESERLKQYEDLVHRELILAEKFASAENVVKTKSAEIARLQKSAETSKLLLKKSNEKIEKLNKQAAKSERLENELEKTEKNFAISAAKLKKLQENVDAHLVAARAQAVLDYKASIEAEKDIEALAQPAVRFGYNSAMEKVNELYPNLKVLEDENFQYYPEEVEKFPIRLAQFKATGNISNHWLENQNA